MKRLPILFFVLALLCFSACHRYDAAEQLLLRADSLSANKPQQALAMLDSFRPQVENLPRSLRMKYHFLHTRAKDKAYIPIADDTVMREVARYYRHHGTANQAAEATYLLGGVYRDRGESPQALDIYLEATEQADTTRSDCDYGLLARIHGQMAELYEKQFHPYLTLEEAEKSMYYALKDKDTVSYYIFMGNKCAAYSFLSKDDSVRITSEKMYQGQHEKGNELLAATSLFSALYICLKQGDIEKGGGISSYL